MTYVVCWEVDAESSPFEAAAGGGKPRTAVISLQPAAEGGGWEVEAVDASTGRAPGALTVLAKLRLMHRPSAFQIPRTAQVYDCGDGPHLFVWDCGDEGFELAILGPELENMMRVADLSVLDLLPAPRAFDELFVPDRLVGRRANSCRRGGSPARLACML